MSATWRPGRRGARAAGAEAPGARPPRALGSRRRAGTPGGGDGRAGEGARLAPVRVAPLALGGSAEPPAGQKVSTGAGTAGARRRAGAVAGFCAVAPVAPARYPVPLSVWSWKGGDIPVGASPASGSPLPGLLPGPAARAAASRAGGRPGRRCERCPRGARSGLWRGACDPRKLAYTLCTGGFSWGSEPRSLSIAAAEGFGGSGNSSAHERSLPLLPAPLAGRECLPVASPGPQPVPWRGRGGTGLLKTRSSRQRQCPFKIH